jgi:hypothetical protein
MDVHMGFFCVPNECRKRDADVLPPHVVALIRERQRRLAAISRYERYIAQAAGHLTLQGFWRNLKQQDLEDAQRIKGWVDREIGDCVPLKSDAVPRCRSSSPTSARRIRP